MNLSTDLLSLMAEVESSRRSVVTVGGEMVTTSWELDYHSHQKAMLMLRLSGVGSCEIEGGIWLVPPQGALWVPGGMMHRVSASGNVEGYATFIQPEAAEKLPETCCTLTINPLLRELIIRSAQFPANDAEEGIEADIAALLIHEISTAPIGNLHLPMPKDPRLRSIFQSMMADPSDRGTIESWAKRAGFSVRSLERILSAETGMSFGRWRQQLSIILALQWMAQGMAVKQVAAELGYENVASFVTMFRKALGVSPARYMAERSGRH